MGPAGGAAGGRRVAFRTPPGRPMDVMGHNTCVVAGRLLGCVPRGGRLVLRELLVGDSVRVLEMDAGLDVEIDWVRYVSVCACGERMLVLAQDSDARALSVELRGPGLDPESVAVHSLLLESDDVIYISWACLTQLSPRLLLMHVYEDPQDYAIDVGAVSLRIRPLRPQGPGRPHRVAPAVRLSASEAATIVEDEERTTPAIMRVEGDRVSYRLFPVSGFTQQIDTSLFRLGRFVLACGGFSDSGGEQDGVFAWDTESGRASWMRPSDGWPFASWLPFMARLGDTLFVVKGQRPWTSFLASLDELADTLESPRVRRDFKAVLRAERGRSDGYSAGDIAAAFSLKANGYHPWTEVPITATL